MTRPRPRRLLQTGWLLAALPLALAACSSSPGSGSGSGSGSGAPSHGSASPSLRHPDATVLGNLTAYASKATSCKSASSPVVCLETADRTLGGQIHTYANLLAVGKGITAPQKDVLAARNQAQTLANSLEILGDAQPTQANYDQVLNNFNLNGAIAQLRSAVNKLDAVVGS